MVDIGLRKKFDAQFALVGKAFKEAGPEGDMSLVTCLSGNEEQKVRQLERMTQELVTWDQELQKQAGGYGRRESMQSFEHSGKREDQVEEGPFENLGAFVKAVIERPNELKDMGITTGEDGGFMVPTSVLTQVLSVAPSASVMRPGATVIPPGDYPDAKVEIPALRQGASGILGGISFTPVDEGTAGKSNDPKLDMVALEPQRFSGYITVGNSLLRNATAMSAFIENTFRNSKAALEDYWFLQGTGGPYPLGILNSPAALKVARTTAGSITFADIGEMIAKQLSDNGVWLCSRSAIKKMIAMADTFGNALWIAGVPEQGDPQPARRVSDLLHLETAGSRHRGRLDFRGSVSLPYPRRFGALRSKLGTRQVQGIADHHQTGRESRRRTLGQGKNHHG